MLQVTPRARDLTKTKVFQPRPHWETRKEDQCRGNREREFSSPPLKNHTWQSVCKRDGKVWRREPPCAFPRPQGSEHRRACPERWVLRRESGPALPPGSASLHTQLKLRAHLTPSWEAPARGAARRRRAPRCPLPHGSGSLHQPVGDVAPRGLARSYDLYHLEGQHTELVRERSWGELGKAAGELPSLCTLRKQLPPSSPLT